MNSAKLKAVIEFTAKVDKSSFGALKKEIDALNGTGSGGGKDNTGSKHVDQSLPKNTKEVEEYNKKGSMSKLFGGKKEDKEGGLGASMGGGMGGAMVGVAAGMKVMSGILEVLQQMLQLIIDSSPLLQAALKLFSTSMKLLFMPLGNMIARILMPIMIKFMQKSAERAQRYANDPNVSIEELTTGAITDMMGALFELVGKIVTEVLPGLLIGLAKGLWAAMTGGDISSGFKESIDKYSDAFKASNLTLTKFSKGMASALDRFGWVMNTANNELGKASSDMATTFYESKSTIEGGFNETSTTYTTGTTKMIEYLNQSFNLVASGASLIYDTITGQAQVFGQSIEGVYNSFIDPINTATTNMNDELGNLGASIANFNSALGGLVTSVSATVKSISSSLRNDTLSGMKSANVKFGNDNVLKASTRAAWGGDDVNATAINAEQARSMGATDVQQGQTYYIRQAGGRFIVSDVEGNIKKQGIYNMEEFKKKVNWKSMTAAMGTSEFQGFMRLQGQTAVWDMLDRAQGENRAYGSGNTEDISRYGQNLATINEANKTTAMASGGITNGPQRALIGEAKREAVVPLGDDLTSRYSNQEIYSRLRGALTPGITDLDQKIDSASGPNAPGASKKTQPVVINLTVNIEGGVWGVEKIEEEFKTMLDKYSYMFKGGY